VREEGGILKKEEDVWERGDLLKDILIHALRWLSAGGSKGKRKNRGWTSLENTKQVRLLPL